MLCPKCGKPMAQATMDGRPAWCCYQCQETLYRQTTGTMDRQPPVAMERAVRGAQEATGGNPSRSKYRNKPETVDGIRFASQGEARRYRDLVLMAASGQIDALEVHPKYELVVGGIRVGRYTADYRYQENGAVIVEDFKSRPTMTASYRLRKRLMLALFGIEIRETAAK